MAAGDIFRALQGVQNFKPATKSVEDAIYYRAYKDALEDLGGDFQNADQQLSGSLKETNPAMGMMPLSTLSTQKNPGDPLGLFEGLSPGLGSQNNTPMLNMPDLQNLRLGSEKNLDLNSALDAISGFGGKAVGAPDFGNYTDDYMQRVKLGLDLLNSRLNTIQGDSQFRMKQQSKSSGKGSTSKRDLHNVPEGTVAIDENGNVIFKNPKSKDKQTHFNVSDGTDVIDENYNLRYSNPKDNKDGDSKNDYTVPKEAIQSFGKIIYDDRVKRRDIQVNNKKHWDETKGHFFKKGSHTPIKKWIDEAETQYGLLSPEDMQKLFESKEMTEDQFKAASAFLNFYNDTVYKSLQKIPPKFFWEQ